MADMTSIEQQRERLEANIKKLHKDLQVWETWDLEYEGLKEELEVLAEDADIARLTAVSQTFQGELLDSKAVREILGLDRPPLRTPMQAIRLISRRQEYVEQNITTLTKQLDGCEYAQADLGPEEPWSASLKPEHNLPIYEITEKLDDHDNVIASSLYQPEAAGAEIQAILKKAGVNMDDQDLSKPASTTASQPDPTPDSDEKNGPRPDEAHFHASNIDMTEPAIDQTISHDRTSDRAVIDGVDGQMTDSGAPRKKSVSFAEDTKPPSEPSRPSSAASNRSDQKSVSFSSVIEEIEAADGKSVTFSPVVEHIVADLPCPPPPTTEPQSSADLSARTRDLAATFPPGSRVIELDDDDSVLANVIMPTDESPEDARLRSEMLAYSLHEVGSVVAELELEESWSDDEDGDGEDNASQYDLTDGTSLSDVDDDDEHGRTRTRVITEEYRKRMLELEKKLDATMIENIGPEIPHDDAELDPRHAHRLVVRDANTSSPDSGTGTSAGADESDTGSKKSVRFAETLDVHHMATESKGRAGLKSSQPVRDVVESFSSATTSRAQDVKPKQSRFKQARQAAKIGSTFAAAAQQQTANTVMLEDIMERAPTSAQAPKAPMMSSSDDDDDDDPEMQRQQLTTEYYRLRNTIIRQQEGGFKESPEEAYEPLMEERDGKVKKVSRFRAARVGGYESGMSSDS